MTLATALEMICRKDLNATLCAARRLTSTDCKAMHDIVQRADREESLKAQR